MSLSEWFFPPLKRSAARSRSLSYGVGGVGFCLLLMGGQAWSHEGMGLDGVDRAIVAAGFGYQNDTESTLTVKVYDAESGEVLSQDVYALSIKEDRGVRSHSPEARIFAGGVGTGATDLSNFVLRVYDAKTGEFQWAGQLDLTANDGSEMGQRVSAVTPRRATVTRIYDAGEIDTPHPLFLLCAWDLSTGRLVWKDEFSPDGKGVALARQIAARSPIFDRVASGGDVFDFRILMVDRGGRTVLWEDRILQQSDDEEIPGTTEDRAQRLPTWTEPIEAESSTGAI